MVDRQAEDVVLLDIQQVSILADYFVIGTVTSERQARAVVDGVRQDLKQSFDVRPTHVEGEPEGGWILMDYGSVVIHLFSAETRRYYDLEGFWRNARVVLRML
jgi:ribosome-associated protein